MGLVDLTTDLKSLRFGKDRIGGGSSNQPYIKSSFPESLSNTDNTGGPDFLLRGGILTPGKIAKDVSRLSQMFFDFKSPNGLLFTAKQNILSRTSVATQASGPALNEGAYLPTSTLLAAAGTPLGLHLNKQGLDPTVRTGPQQGQKGLFDLLGIKDPLGLPIYTNVVTKNQSKEDNRLVQLKFEKIGKFQPNPNSEDPTSSTNQSSNSNGISNNNISLDNGQILTYPGGPGSILGIGNTIIKRYDNTSNNLDFNELSNEGFKNQNFITLDSNQLSTKEASRYNPTIKEDFRKELQPPNPDQSNLTRGISYLDNNIHKRVNLGDPGKRGNKSSYQSGKDGLNLPLDKLNALPLYKSNYVIQDKVKNDLVKFRIGVIDNDNPKKKTYMHFRAFIDSYDDGYSANWNETSYVGRGDKAYRYSGFDRSINLSWTVAAQSKAELIPMYQKLNYLASVCAPDYSSNGYMRGNLITLTVGGWLHEQVGFIKGINYGVPDNSPWEIAIPDSTGTDQSSEGIGKDPSVKELPMIIKVSGFTFVPIHSFLPQLQQNDFKDGASGWNGSELTNGSFIKSYGNERYINLANGSDLERDLQGELLPNAEVIKLDNYGDRSGLESNGNTTYIPVIES